MRLFNDMKPICKSYWKPRNKQMTKAIRNSSNTCVRLNKTENASRFTDNS